MMFKDILLGIGVVAGLGLTGIGSLIYFGFHGDNSDADATAGVVRLFIGIPCLVVGLLLLALCAWGLFR